MKTFWLCLWALSAAFLSLAAAQTQTLPEPATPNTLVTNAQCQGQDEASMGFQLMHSTGSVTAFDNHFAQWISGNTGNTALPSGWTYSAADSSIRANGNTPDIRSQTAYRDFEWRLSYKNSGNDGVFYRMLTRGSFAWSVGVEMGIDNNTSQSNRKITAGAAYDIFAPEPPASQWYNSYASGKWNTVRIVSKGDSVEHWLNNIKVVGYRFWNARWNTAVAGSKWSGSNDFAQNTSGCRCMVVNGYVGFQGDHDGSWHLRNLRITTDASKIQFGPANCGATDLRGKSISHSAPFTSERMASGLRLHLSGEPAVKAELLGLDGREKAPVEIGNDGKTLSIRQWKTPGIYWARISHAQSPPSHHRLFLP